MYHKRKFVSGARCNHGKIPKKTEYIRCGFGYLMQKKIQPHHLTIIRPVTRNQMNTQRKETY
jgi:hypothetical protein